MCTKQDQKGKMAFSCLFRTQLRLPYLPWCQAAWAPCQKLKFFFIEH